jgi:hypothetical protein
MKLEARTYTMDEWNDGIMPLVESGTLTEEKSKYPSFLMVYQKFAGTLVDASGNKFSCVGWAPPTGQMYVDVKSDPIIKEVKPR